MRMKTNRNSNRKRRVLTIFSLVIILVFLVSIDWYVIQDIQKRTRSKTLDVKIYPRDTALSVGQVKTFYSTVSNGSPPYETKWYSNGTFLGVGQQINYTFRESAKYTILSVNTLDSLGNYGFDSIYVFNPTNADMNPGDIPSQAYFTIRTDGTDYWAIRYDGYKAYEGAVAYTVINDAISALTAGRTWKEKVTLRGNFTISSSIVLASYLVLDCLEAKVTCSASIHAITDNGAKQNITIIGGTWVGYTNTANDFVDLQQSNDIYITGCTATNFVHGVEVGSACYKVWISDCSFLAPMGTTNSGAGAYFNGAKDCSVINCRISVWGCGVLTSDGPSTGIRIIGCDISGWKGMLNHAIYLDAGSNRTGLSHGNIVENNIIHDRGANGGTAMIIKSYGNLITGNIFKNLEYWGIYVMSELSWFVACDNMIEDNTFYNCTSAWGGAIYIGSSSGDTPMRNNTNNNQISGNVFYDCYLAVRVGGRTQKTENTVICNNQFRNGRYGVNICNADARYTRIYDNVFDAISTPISDFGTSTEIYRNRGYKTEASGIATGMVNGDTIATGLVANIAWLTVSCNTTGVICTATYATTTITLGLMWHNGTLVDAAHSPCSVYWEARTWTYP